MLAEGFLLSGIDQVLCRIPRLLLHKKDNDFWLLRNMPREVLRPAGQDCSQFAQGKIVWYDP